MEPTLFTIGYEGIDSGEFLTRLIEFKITVVVDVRNLPLSRKKGFSKNSLFEFLQEHGIEYLNYPDLGAAKAIRQELKENLDYDSFFRKMELSISKHENLLDEINDLIEGGQVVALLCYERDFNKCHRKVVADSIRKLNGNGLRIEHLATPKNMLL